VTEGATAGPAPPARRTPGGPISLLLAGGEHPDERLIEARAAARAGDWALARRRFEAFTTGPQPSGQALAGLAVALRLTGAHHEGCAALERAHLAFLEAGDLHQAARAAIALVGQRQGLGEKAASLGWEKRALRILQQIGPCPERGYLAVARTGCEYYDPRELAERAQVALDMAREFDDRELEVRGLGDRGLALLCQGEVDEGFALLDEMMVAVAAGEVVDPETQGKSLCAMLSACERTGDSARADYWCGEIEKDPGMRRIGIVDAHCQIVYGTVDAMRGRWGAAEERLLAAIAQPVSTAYHVANSRSRLAAVRIQQGRYDEAAELLAGIEDHREAAHIVARLHLARGRTHEAAVRLRSAARGMSHDCMRVAPVLALLVEVELLCGDPESADKAARRLSALEDGCSSNEIRALARLALSRIASHRGDHRAAVDELETSLALLTHLDRPLLTAQVRLELARALARARALSTARAEAEAALGIFHRLGVTHDRAAAEKLVDELSREAAWSRTPRHAHEGAASVEALTPREAEVAELVCAGMSNRAIASQLHLSVRTVETHVDRILGKLGHHSRTVLAARYQGRRG
jgi:DNA-binding NarL/FixJ family response regulator